MTTHRSALPKLEASLRRRYAEELYRLLEAYDDDPMNDAAGFTPDFTAPSASNERFLTGELARRMERHFGTPARYDMAGEVVSAFLAKANS